MALTTRRPPRPDIAAPGDQGRLTGQDRCHQGRHDLGGCCRSASITTMNVPLTLANPSWTAPPRPPWRAPGAGAEARPATRGVSSSPPRRGWVVGVVDEKQLPAPLDILQRLGQACRQGADVGASLRVGTTTETEQVSAGTATEPNHTPWDKSVTWQDQALA